MLFGAALLIDNNVFHIQFQWLKLGGHLPEETVRTQGNSFDRRRKYDE